MNHRLPEHAFYAGADMPLAIAHRGGDGADVYEGDQIIGKENSLAAFVSAHEAGITYGETDTVVTSDGHLLAMHGAGNARTSAKTGLPVRSTLQAMTLADVQAEVRVGGEPVPTLNELLDAVPDMRFFIDPKTSEAVEPLARLINDRKLHDRVSVGAFNYGRTRGVTDLVYEQSGQRIANTFGVLGSAMLGAMGKRLPVPSNLMINSGATQFALPHGAITPKMVEVAHDHGKRIVAWTPNTRDDIERSFNKGVDGVMSDKTSLVRDIAGQRGRLRAHLL